MWAPEGSEINDRLKRLQELENMRKEREAKRQEILKNRSQQTTGVITRAARVKATTPETAEPFSLSAGLGIRRTISMRDSENKENYGGARPKVAGFSGSGNTDNWDSLFSDVKSSIITAPRRTFMSDRQYTAGRTRFDSTDSEDSTSGTSLLKAKYSRSVSQPQDTESGSLFSSVTQSGTNPKGSVYERRAYLNRNMEGFRFNDGTLNSRYDDGESGEQEDLSQNGTSEHFEKSSHEGQETNDYEDEGEEPLHFIARLKNGSNGSQNGNTYNSQLFSSIPTVPPLVQTFDNEGNQYNENSEQSENIISAAKDISSAFGVRSPTSPKQRFSPYNRKEKSGSKVEPDQNVSYDIVHVDNDSSGDEEGKTLTINTNSRLSEWNVEEQGPGDLDEIQAYFTGRAVDQDPNISRVLDGERVKAELEYSFSEPTKTPGKAKGNEELHVQKEVKAKKPKPKVAKKPDRSVQSPVDRIKNGRTVTKCSGSENDSRPTSESESEMLDKKKKESRSKVSEQGKTERSQSITDKLAKLEAMAHEKTRRRSAGETEMKRSIPSYMSSTSASQKKTSRTKETSKPNTTDLKKDIRDLRQFVREKSVESESERKAMTKEISVQTDIAFNIDDAYICKHCGKSSADDVATLLTVENINLTVVNGKLHENLEHKDQNFSSKDSIKSLGESSSKSDKSSVKSKQTSSAASYMKGTTSSRLKNNGNDTEGQKSILTPEVMLYPGNEVGKAKAKSNLKGTVSQKTKAFEGKEKKTQPSLSLFRGNSADRSKGKTETENRKSKLQKSKSVDQVHILKGSQKKFTLPKQSKETVIGKDSRSSTEEEVKIDLTVFHSPRSQTKSKKPIGSPRSAPVSPRRKEILDISVESVESKGQFTTIVDNPFIKNDGKRKNSFKGKEIGSSVWEKAESHSREHSLSRPGSAAETASVGTSSAGEGRSLSHLSWSDSGSTESLNKSKSETHGSYASINETLDQVVFDDSTSGKTSASSDSGQNGMLNLLPPMSKEQPSEFGAKETDIDAAFKSSQKEKPPKATVEHNEETVERAHLEFAKKACHLLDTELKKRDSSNESNGKRQTVKTSTKPHTRNGTSETNGIADAPIEKDTGKKSSGSKKGKKGFLKKGKLFRK